MIAGAIAWMAVAAPTPVEAWLERETAGEGRLPALSTVLHEAEAEAGLGAKSAARRWLGRVRWRAWVPQIDARFGTDRSIDVRDATTTSWVRTGEGFGLQVRLRWSLADAVFNDGVLRVDKALRDQGAARLAIRERLVELYFERLALEVQGLRSGAEDPSTRAERVARTVQLDALFRALTGGRARFGRRSANPWPEVVP